MKYLQQYNEFNDANLTINNNPKSVKFDGGDGPSATEVPEPYHQTVNKPLKLKRGSNVKEKQQEREKTQKKNAKEFRISKLMNYQTTDDINKFVENPRINSNAGGSTL